MTPTSILFVCLGNICRSPMAEGVFNKILDRENAGTRFRVDSAGLLDYHKGNLPDSRMRSHASQRGYELVHRSRPVTKADFHRFDLIIAMDEDNIKGLNRLASTQADASKILRMADFCRRMQATHIPDPYYGGDKGFQHVIDLLEDACEGLYEKLAED